MLLVSNFTIENGAKRVLSELSELSFVNSYSGGGLFYNTKWYKNSWKMTEILAHGYSSESTK